MMVRLTLREARTLAEAWGNKKMGDFDWLVEGIIGSPQ
jgi:hypothetical protein